MFELQRQKNALQTFINMINNLCKLVGAKDKILKSICVTFGDKLNEVVLLAIINPNFLFTNYYCSPFLLLLKLDKPHSPILFYRIENFQSSIGRKS